MNIKNVLVKKVILLLIKDIQYMKEMNVTVCTGCLLSLIIKTFQTTCIFKIRHKMSILVDKNS